MRTVDVESKLKKLQDRKSAITAKMQKLEASTRTIARKQELQKKILVGTYYLEQAVNNGALSELKAILLKNLQRESDRKLFEDL
jgi:hypothetical protein